MAKKCTKSVLYEQSFCFANRTYCCVPVIVSWALHNLGPLLHGSGAPQVGEITRLGGGGGGKKITLLYMQY